MRNWIHYNELNEVMNCKSSVKNNIVPGMGATMYVGSDRYPMVVTEVISPKKVKVAHLMDSHIDKLILKDGTHILPEEYLKEYKNFTKDEFGFGSYYAADVYTLRKNGRWMKAGEGLWGTGSIHIGYVDEYRDPSF